MLKLKPFLRSDQFNFIKSQIQIVINGYASSHDSAVLSALTELTSEKVSLVCKMNEEQRQVIDKIAIVTGREAADEYLLQVQQYVIPFPNVTEQMIKKVFPKVKKLKIPNLENVDLKEISYVSWNDKGSNKRYMITKYENKLLGLHGSFTSINKKGICAICNHHEELGMFVSKVKGSSIGTFTTKGNYICVDSQKCNNNLTSMKKLHDFFEIHA